MMKFSSSSLINQIKKNLGIQLSADPCRAIKLSQWIIWYPNLVLAYFHYFSLPYESLEDLINMHSYKQIKN